MKKQKECKHKWEVAKAYAYSVAGMGVEEVIFACLKCQSVKTVRSS